MKEKFLFLRMIWRVLTKKENGWVFFRLSDEQQSTLKYGGYTFDKNIRYFGVDKEVIELLARRLETPLKLRSHHEVRINSKGEINYAPDKKYKGGGNAVGSSNQYTKEYAKWLDGKTVQDLIDERSEILKLSKLHMKHSESGNGYVEEIIEKLEK